MLNPTLFVEERVMIDSFGNLTDLEVNAIIHGFLDVLWRQSAKVGRFRDWKSGYWEAYNEFESRCYALLTRAFFPGVTTVIAELCYLRTGHVIRTEYEWQDNNQICIVTQDGVSQQLWSETDPILEYMLVRLDQILMTEAKPRPGGHCSNWYGKPCQFFMKECPLTPKDAQMDYALPIIADSIDYANSLADVCRGKDLTSKLASDGYYAIQQMKQFLANAEERIEEFATKHGPIMVGNTPYGWKKSQEYEVDKKYVIEALIRDDVPIEDWDKIINISKTSLSKLSKKKYGDLRDELEAFAVKTLEGKTKFGKITKELS